jgi:hypothetical protein
MVAQHAYRFNNQRKESKMKKIFLLSLALLLVGVWVLPASAIEHEFGGFWRMRAYHLNNFSGDDSGDQDKQLADTRARLYYTAIFNDDLKFVSKFEMDAVFGDTERGDIGADGQNFEIKNSYIDFNESDFNFKLGTQGKVVARGFILDDDFSGAVVTYKRDEMKIPFFWIKAYEGFEDANESGNDGNDFDVDYYGVEPTITAGDLEVTPLAMYITSGDVGEWATFTENDALAAYEDLDLYYLGLSLDLSAEMFSAWFTGIYETGTFETADDDINVAAYLAAVGGSISLDGFSVHGEVFYATGDDDADDDDWNQFIVPKGQSYYWAEIMGYGLFDDYSSEGAPADQIGNIMAFNVGVTFPMGKLTLMADLWYASLAEDNAEGDKDLGTEIDLAASYQLQENLKLQAVAAYLAAGDATGGGDENPTEVGAQISVSF